MMRTLFPRDLFAELDRLQREFSPYAPYLPHSRYTEASPSIRGVGRSGYPALNVGSTSQSIEIYAFAPGLDPMKIDVQIEKGVLSISGERPADRPVAEKAAIHIDERFAGRFRRVVRLPDDADANAVSASYRDGVLHVSIRRRESATPRRVEIQ